MSGTLLRVQLEEGATPPMAANKPAEVLNAFKAKVKADLDRDEQLGVIERVPPNTPQTYCARVLVVAKHNGKPRCVVNFKVLNNMSAADSPHTGAIQNCLQHPDRPTSNNC